MKINEKPNKINSKFLGYCALKVKCKIVTNSVHKVIRITDARIVEYQYVSKKYGIELDFIDLEARNTFPIKEVILSVIKCAHESNYCRVRDMMINNKMIGEEYPRCSKVETWDYVIKYNETKYLRKIFIKDLLKEMIKNKPSYIEVNEIFSIIEDILQYIE